MPRAWPAAVIAVLVAVVLAGCERDPVHPASPPGEPGRPQPALAAAAQDGSWTAPFSWPIVAAHLTVLPDGRVLSWTSNDMDHTFNTPNVYVWDPARPAAGFTQVPNTFTDVFCSAHSFLPDGKLLVTGGHIEDGAGSRDGNIFNYQGATWGQPVRMRAGRWYPTSMTLGNGEVVVVAGTDEHHAANPYPEVWDGSKFRLLSGAALEIPYYPWLHLAPDGRVFNSGPEQPTRYLNPTGEGAWTYFGRTTGGIYRDYGTSVMYEPGKVLIIGGGDSPPVKTAEIVNLNAGSGWQRTGDMAHARRQHNATVLADGKVLVTGGTSAPGFNNEDGQVLAAELWNPATGSWTTLASMKVGRQYHSTAVLLPDGRVLSAGGGRCGACRVDHRDAEIFSPPYLFNSDGSAAARPTISSAPTAVDLGQTFTIGTPDGASVTRATLVRLPSTTHGFNMNQGFVSLPASAPTGGVSVTTPASAHVAPPGHYMLFILNGSGVPSVAKIVQLRATAAPPPATALAAPTSLTASAADAGQISLRWVDNSTDESAFHVERCQGAGCSTGSAEIARVGQNLTGYTDAGLAAGTTYGYRVRAANGNGYSAYSNTASATTTTALSLTARGYKVKGLQRVDLTWSSATTEDVDLYRGGVLIATRANVAPFSYTDALNRKGAGTYTYKACEHGGTAVCSRDVTVSF